MTIDPMVVAIVESAFPDQMEEALEALSAYTGPEIVRVQLGMLKNSNEDIKKLRDQSELARLDYRDVLAWAEYPRQMSVPPGQATTEMIRADRDNYEEWLRKSQ